MLPIEKLLQQFSKTKVLVLGDVMLDHYLSGGVERVSPEAPVPVVSVKDEYYRLGGAANVALNLKALGIDPILCSVVGNDEAAQQFQKAISEAGISDEYLIQSDSRPTTVKTRVLSRSQQLMRIDRESVSDLSDGESSALKEKLSEIFEEQSPEVLILQDYDKGVLSKSIIEFAIDLAKKHKTLIAVDPKFRHFFDFKQVDLFKPNLAEMKKALSLEDLPIEELETHSKTFMQEQGHKNLMITLSDKGVYWNIGVSGAQYPAKVRNIADVSGAGDTVIAVAAIALYHGLDTADICQLSNTAGGIVCESLGVVPVDTDKLADEWRKA